MKLHHHSDRIRSVGIEFIRVRVTLQETFENVGGKSKKQKLNRDWVPVRKQEELLVWIAAHFLALKLRDE